MTTKLLIAAVLLIAVASAGTMTTHSPPRNKTTSHPPPPETDSPPPPPPKTDSPPPPPPEADSPPPPPPKTGSPPSPSPTASAPPPSSQPKTVSPPPPSPTASAPSPRPAKIKANCSDELVAVSKCLPYISTYPNNVTCAPSRQCCRDFTSAYFSGSAVCFCYLVKKPELLGFPLNTTRILSLSDLCPTTERKTGDHFSLRSLCSDITLPPLSGVTIPGRLKPHTSAGFAPPVPQDYDAVAPKPPHSGVNFSQDDSITPGQGDNSDSPEETFQVIPAWRSIDINYSSVVQARFCLSWWLSVMLLLMFFPADWI